jgi:hypothetical protein
LIHDDIGSQIGSPLEFGLSELSSLGVHHGKKIASGPKGALKLPFEAPDWVIGRACAARSVLAASFDHPY